MTKTVEQLVFNYEKIYVFPCGRIGKNIADIIDYHNNHIFAFVDNMRCGQEYKSIPIIKPDEINDVNSLVILATLMFSKDMLQQLSNLGIKNVLTFEKLIEDYPEFRQAHPYIYGMENDLKENVEKYEALYQYLLDDKSYQVLDAIVNYRKTFNLKFLKDVTELSNEKQYFEDFMPKHKIFVDGGGFDGDTTKRYASFVRSYSKVYFLEPDKQNMLKAKDELKSYLNIQYYDYALSDKEGVAFFNECNDEGSCLTTTQANTKVNTIDLDTLVKEDTAFIKLDVEGAECDVIKGAKRLIKNGSPLAIVLEHKVSDVWQIYQQILDINSSYRFYLRHYNPISVFETVLYGSEK